MFNTKLALIAGAGTGLGLFLVSRATSLFDTGPNIAKRAEDQLKKWNGLVETDPLGTQLVNTYWDRLNQKQPIDIAWSGAFIQDTVQGSDYPDSLFPSAAHFYYAAQAYKNRGVEGKYGAYRPDEYPIAKNDIILTTRGTPIKFEDLIRDPGTFRQSHGDVATKLSAGSVRGIGGNVSNTVGARDFQLNSAGYVIDPRVWGVLKLQRKGHVYV